MKCFQKFLLAEPFGLRKITTDPRIFAHVNIVSLDDRYPKLKICISQPILDSYEYVLIMYMTMHCMI